MACRFGKVEIKLQLSIVWSDKKEGVYNLP